MYPVLFDIPLGGGSISFHGYGLFLGLACLLGWQITARRFTGGAKNEPATATLSVGLFIVLLSGLCGARAGYLIGHLVSQGLSLTQDPASPLMQGGLDAFAAVSAGLIAGRLFFRDQFLRFFDAALPAVFIGFAVTAVGSYLSGSYFGTLLHGGPGWLKAVSTYSRWPAVDGVITGPPAWVYQVEHQITPSHAAYAAPVHPVQLYDIIWSLLCLLGARRLTRRYPLGPSRVLLPLSVFVLGRALAIGLVWEPVEGRPIASFLFATLLLLTAAIYAWRTRPPSMRRKERIDDDHGANRNVSRDASRDVSSDDMEALENENDRDGQTASD